MPPLSQQLIWLFVLAIPVSCVAWTVTHEEVFREPREYCRRMSEHGQNLAVRKFFYLFTCEFCFSHWVTLLFLLLTQYKLLLPDWRGYLLSFFSVVWVANLYMSALARLRVDIRSERAEATTKEKQAQKIEREICAADREAGDGRAGPPKGERPVEGQAKART
jgi:hypothetical protein